MTATRREESSAQGFPASKLKRFGRALVEAVKDLFKDNGTKWAASVAYYGMLSLFPLLLAAVSIAAYFVNPDWAVEQLVRMLGEFLPQGEQRISETMKGVFDARGPASIFSLLLLLWSGSRVFGALVKAINRAYDVEESYSFLKRRAAELIMTLTIGLLFVAALVSRSILRYIGSQTDQWLGQGSFLLSVVQNLVPALLLFVVFYLIYRFAPKPDIDSRAALIGAATALVIFLIARPLFLGYIDRIANFNLVYGSLAVVVILMIWAWMISLIILFGGEVTSKVQKMFFERNG